MSKHQFVVGDEIVELIYERLKGNAISYSVQDGNQQEVSLTQLDDQTLLISHSGGSVKAFVAEDDNTLYVSINGEQFFLEKVTARNALRGNGDNEVIGNEIEAPMPGKLLKVFVSAGEEIEAGQRLFILEAMKMENEVKAPRAGSIKTIHFAEGELVSVGQTIIELADAD